MAITSPGYAQSGVATSQFPYAVLLNDLNSNDRSYVKDLIYKYGNENYALVMMAMGKYMDIDYTDNHQFYHYEKRQLHQSFAVASQVASTGAGNSATVQVGTGDYYENGNRSPIRAGEVMILASSGIQVIVVSVNTSTANAHTAVVRPLSSSQNIASAGSTNILAGDLFLFRGAVNVGEGSTVLSGISPVWDRITNTITEHRDDFVITDIASMEKQEIKVAANGQPYYRDIAVDEVNKRWLNDQFWKIMEGVAATNTGLTTNIGNGSTNGTQGVIPYAQNGGSTVQYNAGAPTLSDWQALARQLKYYGGASDYHLLMDLQSKQSMDTFLFTTFKQTYDLVNWEHAGGSKEAAVAFGFDTWRMNDITWHFFFNPQFSTTMIYKRPTPLGSSYDNFTLCIPQRQNIGRNGQSLPSFQLVWQKQPNGDRVSTFETGGMAMQNKTTTLNRTFTQSGYYGPRVFGAVGYGIFQGV